MLKEHNVRRGFLEPSQFAAVQAHLPAALRPLLAFDYLTGWRLASEVMPLEWRQVDWEGRTIRLEPGTTKNDEGRTFPFTAALEAILVAQKAVHDGLRKAGRIVPFVFHRNGKRIKHCRKAWDTACTQAGVPGRLLHDMRRSVVRNLERDGVPRSAARRWWDTRPNRSIGGRRSSMRARSGTPRRRSITRQGQFQGQSVRISRNSRPSNPRKSLSLNGAGGGGRTLTTRRSRDFESRASASFTTPAGRDEPFKYTAGITRPPPDLNVGPARPPPKVDPTVPNLKVGPAP
jgi:hypothetical protein